MSKIIIKKIIWDDWNINHIKRHKVKPREVELALKDENRKILRTYNDRLLILGRAEKRLLTVVLAEETKSEYYLVTARDMSKKERSFYRNEKK